MSMSNLRQRQKRRQSDVDSDSSAPDVAPVDSNSSENTPQGEDETEVDDRGISVLDIFRILLILVCSSSVLSYYVTSDSLIWGYKRPWFTSLPRLKSYLHGPVLLTPSDLALYNGSSTSLPVYVSINGTVYDVSASRHIYGPGGSYSFFAGRDATRAFVTGCFKEDLTGDLRGVEEMFVPVEDYDDGEEERQMSEAQKRGRKKQELADAKKKVKKTVEKWEGFFGNHDKYFEAGKLVDSTEDEGNLKPLCEAARKARPKRSKMRQKERERRAKEGK